MKFSELFVKTLKDVPSDETSRNAQLLIRAGYISKSMAGAYSLLPLGLRVMRKIEAIVHKHMLSIGAQEVLLNNLQPKSWWETVNSWDHEANDALFHVPSLNLPGVEYALSSSNEENITTIASLYIHSYKDLPEYIQGKQWPLSIYQIHTKFRDEMRPKAGLMRGREFRMKDMYDFHRTKESQSRYFDEVTNAYLNCFAELGLNAIIVNASGGAFSDKFSREFQVICDAGEDRLYSVPETDLVYNEEVAPAGIPEDISYEEAEEPLQEHVAEGVVGVEALTELFGISAKKTTKTLLYVDDNNKMVVAVIRGDREVSEEKLRAVHGSKIRLATDSEVRSWTGCEIGYAGLYKLPRNANMSVYIDTSVEKLKNFETGGNSTGLHVTNFNLGRDYPIPSQFYDIKKAAEGDIHPETGKVYSVHKGAEIGNIFDLGTRYTAALGVRYSNEENKISIPYMGCHGIGITRVMGVLAELYNDEKGLKWPSTVAPFHYHLITLWDKDDTKNTKIREAGMKFYTAHENNVLWDDRDVSFGQKIADAELIGCPEIHIISAKTLESGVPEVRYRNS